MNSEGLKVLTKHSCITDGFRQAPPHNAPPMSPATPSSTPAMSDSPSASYSQEDVSLSTPHSSSGSRSPVKRGSSYMYPETRIGDYPSSSVVFAAGRAHCLPQLSAPTTAAHTTSSPPIRGERASIPPCQKPATREGSNGLERKDSSIRQDKGAPGSSLVRGGGLEGAVIQTIQTETSPYSGRMMERSLSQNMGAMGGLFGTLGMGDVTAVRRPGAVARGMPRPGESLDRPGSGVATLRAAPARRHAELTSGWGGADSTHVAVDIAALEIKSNKQKSGMVEVAAEFPGLNLKPIRTRPPLDKPPSVHVTRIQATAVPQPSLTPEGFHSLYPASCMRGGWQQIMAGLGAIVGSLFSSFMYVVKGN